MDSTEISSNISSGALFRCVKCRLDRNHIYRRLACGHRLCVTCLFKCYESDHYLKKDICCPACEIPTVCIFSDVRIQDFDFSLNDVELFCDPCQKKKRVKNTQDLWYCTNCCEILCGDCAVSYGHKQHHFHTIRDTDVRDYYFEKFRRIYLFCVGEAEKATRIRLRKFLSNVEGAVIGELFPKNIGPCLSGAINNLSRENLADDLGILFTAEHSPSTNFLLTAYGHEFTAAMDDVAYHILRFVNKANAETYVTLDTSDVQNGETSNRLTEQSCNSLVQSPDIKSNPNSSGSKNNSRRIIIEPIAGGESILIFDTRDNSILFKSIWKSISFTPACYIGSFKTVYAMSVRNDRIALLFSYDKVHLSLSIYRLYNPSSRKGIFLEQEVETELPAIANRQWFSSTASDVSLSMKFASASCIYFSHNLHRGSMWDSRIFVAYFDAGVTRRWTTENVYPGSETFSMDTEEAMLLAVDCSSGYLYQDIIFAHGSNVFRLREEICSKIAVDFRTPYYWNEKNRSLLWLNSAGELMQLFTEDDSLKIVAKFDAEPVSILKTSCEFRNLNFLGTALVFKNVRDQLFFLGVNESSGKNGIKDVTVFWPGGK